MIRQDTSLDRIRDTYIVLQGGSSSISAEEGSFFGLRECRKVPSSSLGNILIGFLQDAYQGRVQQVNEDAVVIDIMVLLRV